MDNPHNKKPRITLQDLPDLPDQRIKVEDNGGYDNRGLCLEMEQDTFLIGQGLTDKPIQLQCNTLITEANRFLQRTFREENGCLSAYQLALQALKGMINSLVEPIGIEDPIVSRTDALIEDINKKVHDRQERHRFKVPTLPMLSSFLKSTAEDRKDALEELEKHPAVIATAMFSLLAEFREKREITGEGKEKVERLLEKLIQALGSPDKLYLSVNHHLLREYKPDNDIVLWIPLVWKGAITGINKDEKIYKEESLQSIDQFVAKKLSSQLEQLKDNPLHNAFRSFLENIPKVWEPVRNKNEKDAHYLFGLLMNGLSSWMGMNNIHTNQSNDSFHLSQYKNAFPDGFKLCEISLRFCQRNRFVEGNHLALLPIPTLSEISSDGWRLESPSSIAVRLCALMQGNKQPRKPEIHREILKMRDKLAEMIAMIKGVKLSKVDNAVIKGVKLSKVDNAVKFANKEISSYSSPGWDVSPLSNFLKNSNLRLHTTKFANKEISSYSSPGWDVSPLSNFLKNSNLRLHTTSQMSLLEAMSRMNLDEHSSSTTFKDEEEWGDYVPLDDDLKYQGVVIKQESREVTPDMFRGAVTSINSKPADEEEISLIEKFKKEMLQKWKEIKSQEEIELLNEEVYKELPIDSACISLLIHSITIKASKEHFENRLNYTLYPLRWLLREKNLLSVNTIPKRVREIAIRYLIDLGLPNNGEAISYWLNYVQLVKFLFQAARRDKKKDLRPVFCYLPILKILTDHYREWKDNGYERCLNPDWLVTVDNLISDANGDQGWAISKQKYFLQELPPLSYLLEHSPENRLQKLNRLKEDPMFLAASIYSESQMFNDVRIKWLNPQRKSAANDLENTKLIFQGGHARIKKLSTELFGMVKEDSGASGNKKAIKLGNESIKQFNTTLDIINRSTRAEPTQGLEALPTLSKLLEQEALEHSCHEEEGNQSTKTFNEDEGRFKRAYSSDDDDEVKIILDDSTPNKRMRM